MKITIENIISELELNSGWIEEQFRQWDEDEGNSFSLGNKKNCLTKEAIYEIAETIMDDMVNNYELSSMDDAKKKFDGIIEDSNYYWDLFYRELK